MKTFAELNADNVVVTVIITEDNITEENISEHFDHSMDGVDWKESGNVEDYTPGGSNVGFMRKRPAVVKGTYDSENDVFLRIKPFNSWVLNTKFEWVAPVVYPSISGDIENNVSYSVNWNEDNQQWTCQIPGNDYVSIWNPDTLSWS